MITVVWWLIWYGVAAVFAWGGVQQAEGGGGPAWMAAAGAQLAIAAAIAAGTAVAQARYCASGVPAARRELLALARAAGEGTRVSPRDHLVLSVSGPGDRRAPGWTVTRVDDSQYAEARPHGRIVMTGEIFAVTPVWPGVARKVEGVAGVRYPGGEFRDETPPAEMSWRDLCRLLYGVAAARGADAAEIRELAGQLRAAEPLG